MRNLFIALLLCTSIARSFAAPSLEPVKNRVNAKEIFFPIANSNKKISLFDLSRISAGDLQSLSGRKMNFPERVSFNIAQKKLRKNIHEDGSVNSRKLQRFFKSSSGETGFHIGGFALGFFLGLIGIVISYVMQDDYRRNRIKWAWIGWGVWVALWISLLLLLS